MTYTMTLDNSWELMSEDEMYEVNGGWLVPTIEWTLNISLFAANAALNTARIFGKKAIFNFVTKNIGSWVYTAILAFSLTNLTGLVFKWIFFF